MGVGLLLAVAVRTSLCAWLCSGCCLGAALASVFQGLGNLHMHLQALHSYSADWVPKCVPHHSGQVCHQTGPGLVNRPTGVAACRPSLPTHSTEHCRHLPGRQAALGRVSVSLQLLLGQSNIIPLLYCWCPVGGGRLEVCMRVVGR